MHTLRVTSCAIVIAAVLTSCAGSDRGKDTASSNGVVAAGPATDSAPAATSPTGSISTASAAGVGRYLTDESGRALYMFERDTKNTSTCSAADGCAVAWPPVSVGTPPSADSSVQVAMLGSISRADARMQATYDGKPLYYYEDDKKAGDIEGQGKLEFGGLWYLVSPSGQEIKKGGKGGH
jgi:predicted lipoprotein with Yx(FWY)xxD motif